MKNELMKRHLDFVAKLKAKRVKFAVYECPNTRCKFGIETRVPPKGEKWDSCATCPKCGNVHFKIVEPSGFVVVQKLPTQRRKVAA